MEKVREELEGANKDLEESREEMRKLRKTLKDTKRREVEPRGKVKAFEKERQGWKGEREALLRSVEEGKDAAERSAVAVQDVNTRHQAEILELGNMVVTLEREREALPGEITKLSTRSDKRRQALESTRSISSDAITHNYNKNSLTSHARRHRLNARLITASDTYTGFTATPTHAEHHHLQRQVDSLLEQSTVLRSEKESLQEQIKELRRRDAESFAKWARADLGNKCEALETAQHDLAVALTATLKLRSQLKQCQNTFRKQMAVMEVLETDTQEAAVEVIELRWRLTAACAELRRVEQIAYGKGEKDVEVGAEGDQKAAVQLVKTLQD
ncbi:hypothetical protein QFC20_004019 [Naganishia adeliensis]|uniref:Uncharacterized protein n=1 Tax=Naganishia adeliensis TaxID=92952 RepID=A0ACC2W4N9_9TREE|nr:hypothetical protein QFC20_004019 [Naganishia adeliensis]